MSEPRHLPALGPQNFRTMARQLLPGLVLPGLVYFTLARHTGTLPALAAASLVPALDAVIRVVRGKRPTIVSTAFLTITGLSIGLATWFDAPWFITGKGAAISAALGIALVLSARARRPLTRTVAVRLCSEDAEARRDLTRRWSRPQTTEVFRTLALGWGLWLLISALQQGAMVALVSPGVFMAIEPPVRLALTAVGVVVSVVYVRRCQEEDPELALLPSRRTL